MGKYVVFIEETGNNNQERFFGLGVLVVPIAKIGEYLELLQSSYNRIHQSVQDKDKQLRNELSGEDLLNYLKRSGKPYEMKFKHINETTKEGYRRLLSTYFNFSDVRFCSYILDRSKYPSPKGMSFFDVYIKQLCMVVNNIMRSHDAKGSYLLVADNISIPKGREYENEIMKMIKYDCFGVLRTESHSSYFLQLVDVLIGGSVYDLRPEKSNPKIAVLEKLKEKLDAPNFSANFVKRRDNENLFTNWVYCKK